ncbi:MAG: (2Fe-2S)-binding protein [Deltaproteobacteria bacterium]|nr:MAG: (2Fe-2S)-binding protein [Deltaproteobacteria bacterium]
MRKVVKLKVNGVEDEKAVKPGTTLAEFLRYELGLTGTKIGCDQGACGACTVLIDGKAIKSCSVLALQANGKEVVTIEGLAEEGKLHPLQEAWLDHGAYQCGFCTSGMILTAKALLDENPDPSEEEIKEGIRGNLCRCTGYVKIIEAIRSVAERRKAGQKEGH